MKTNLKNVFAFTLSGWNDQSVSDVKTELVFASECETSFWTLHDRQRNSRGRGSGNRTTFTPGIRRHKIANPVSYDARLHSTVMMYTTKGKSFPRYVNIFSGYLPFLAASTVELLKKLFAQNVLPGKWNTVITTTLFSKKPKKFTNQSRKCHF